MADKTHRTLVAHNIHGHIYPGTPDESTLDYPLFFSQLRDAKSEDRMFEYRGSTLAVTSYRAIGDRHAFLFVSGNDSESVLSLNLNTASTTEVKADVNNIFVRGRWVIVDPVTRVVVMESKRPTVSKQEVEILLEAFGEKYLDLGTLEISINQIASSYFAEQIESMTRIREASVVLSRPNSSWLEDADELVDQVSESGATSIEVTARASKNQSLDKRKGIVKTIIGYSQSRLSSIKNAHVTGRLPNSNAETTVRLDKSALKGSAELTKSATASKQLDQMAGTIDDIFTQSAERQS